MLSTSIVLVSKAGDQMEMKTRILDFSKARNSRIAQKVQPRFSSLTVYSQDGFLVVQQLHIYLYFSREETTSALSSATMMFWRIFPFSLLLKEEACSIVSWSKRGGCVCISGGACTCQRQLRQRNNPHKISCTYKPDFWISCHRSGWSVKKKNQNRNLKECTQSQIRLTLLGFHSANNFCTISHFWTFTDYQKRDKNIFYDGTP